MAETNVEIDQDQSQGRYDLFQPDAVAAIVEDFSKKPSGRFLLVVPTAGGKTTIAARAVHDLFECGKLRADVDRVMWVAHRIELLDQAKATVQSHAERCNGPTFSDRIDFCMLAGVKGHLEEHDEIRLVVIDEAHHGAAQSYKPIFERERDLGVLGLTATPSRHDGAPLDFKKESYSIVPFLAHSPSSGGHCSSPTRRCPPSSRA